MGTDSDQDVGTVADFAVAEYWNIPKEETSVFLQQNESGAARWSALPEGVSENQSSLEQIMALCGVPIRD